MVRSCDYNKQESLFPLDLDTIPSCTESMAKEADKKMGLQLWEERKWPTSNIFNMGTNLEHGVPRHPEYKNRNSQTFNYIKRVIECFGFKSFNDFINDKINLTRCDSWWNINIKSSYLMPVGWYLYHTWKVHAKKKYTDSQWLHLCFWVIFTNYQHMCYPFDKSITDPITYKKTSPIHEWCYATSGILTHNDFEDVRSLRLYILFNWYLYPLAEEIARIRTHRKRQHLRLVKG